MKFSVIIPVYNRPDEIEALLESLASQTSKNFEVVITEDGSTVPCKDVVDKYSDRVDVSYFSKENEGRSIARNHSMSHSKGDWFVFFDSDCVIPPTYFETLGKALAEHPEIDCFGGPDAAHESFDTTQKAISFAMTSLLTTGGIRGGKVSLERFTPRTFNMGLSRKVYDAVGGFREMFSEDIDMSKRIEAAGFRTALLRQVPVWHKRRINLKKFMRQVHVFGMSRITLHQLYPGSLKIVHTLPAIATLLFVALVVLGIAVSPWFFMPIGIYAIAIFISALSKYRSFIVALKALPASFVQITGYGTGFLRAFFTNIILGKGRRPELEIKMRKGK